MSNKRRTREIQSDEEVLDLEIPSSEEQEEIIWSPGETLPKYVVVRGNSRVSDKDYTDPNDPRAISEMNFWKKVISRWPDGTKIEIVPYDKKKHRVW